MSWFFNSDYESFLFSGREKYQFNSSKINQEFEYFIHFFENEPIFTLKEYDTGFIKSIEAISGKDFKTESRFEGAKPWCCAIGDLKTDRLLHSKITSTEFSVENGYESKARITDSSNFIPKVGYLYKMEGELSGRGHLLWPMHKEKIEKLLERGARFLEEPLRNRTRDFSALVLSETDIRIYENIVDEKFQYKGTVISTDGVRGLDKTSYLEIIKKTASYYRSKGADFPFSVDSYFYLEDGEEKLCPISEVNVRKTMGFTANMLAEITDSQNFAMLILPNGKTVEDAISLAPVGNRFQTTLINAQSGEELRNLIDRTCRVG